MSINNMANMQSKEYLKNFAEYLKKSHKWTEIIQIGLNSPQGFSAISYLRFVR